MISRFQVNKLQQTIAEQKDELERSQVRAARPPARPPATLAVVLRTKPLSTPSALSR